MIDWEGILREHGPSVWRTAYRLTANRADAEECFQETFVAALEYVRQGKSVQHWRALLQRIATTRAIDRLRRRATLRNREGFLDQEAEHPPPSG